MAKRRQPRKKSGLHPLVTLLIVLVVVGVVGGGVAFVVINALRNVPTGTGSPTPNPGPANPGPNPTNPVVTAEPQYRPNAEAARQLQDTAYTFPRTRFRLRLPKGFDAEYSVMGFEERITCRDRQADGTFLYLQVTAVPDDVWINPGNNLAPYIDEASMKLSEDRVAFSKRGGPKDYAIQAIPFVRQEADGRPPAGGRTDRYVFYYGASRPYLIMANLCCTPERTADLLPVLEEAVWTLRR